MHNKEYALKLVQDKINGLNNNLYLYSYIPHYEFLPFCTHFRNQNTIIIKFYYS